MHISKNDFVLEIGSGHRPHKRADVLVDMFIEDTEERAEQIKRDGRPLINAAGEALPFKDKSFDYVICRHVLEHSTDPELFLNELQRIGKRGFIESPSPVWEFIYTPRKYHRCLLFFDKTKNLLIIKKRCSNEYSPFGRLFAYLYEHDIIYRLFHSSHNELFFTKIEWEGEIPFKVLSQKDHIMPNFNESETIKEYLEPKLTLATKRGRFLYRFFSLISRKMGL